MKNSKKLILVMISIICIVILLVGSIAYYRIVVSGSITGSTGNAVFVLRDSDNSVWNNKVIDLGKINPGDSGEFTVTLDASGSVVDMYATLEIERTNLPTNLKFYTTSDHKSELHKYYSFLEKTNQTETLTIYWYWNPYIDDVEDGKFINVSNLEANVRVNAIQISEYAMMKNGTVSEQAFWSDAYKPYIRTVEFGNDLSKLPSECTEDNLCWDVSYDASQKKKVYGYLIDSGLTVSETDSSTSTTVNKTLYNLYIVSEAPIFAPTVCGYMFERFTNLKTIDFNNNFNTSNVTDMSYMFYKCSSLTNLDLSNFNTSNVTDMERMFDTCSSLTELDLSSFNTSKVTNMNSMFCRCSSLTNLDISNFNTSKVTNMSSMFMSYSSLASLDLSNFNTSNVTDMSSMFYRCESSTNLDLSNFNTSKVTDISFMFGYCSSLTELDLSSFNTSKVTDMSYMFRDCSSLTNLDLSNFNTSNVTNMGGMFISCSSLASLDLSKFNTSKVTTMGSMFYFCESLTNLDLSNFNTSNVTDMSYMFYKCSSLTELELSNFNTSKVTNMSWMFNNCSSLTTTINIMNANVTSYGNMFSNAATASGSKITVNYIADASALVDNMIATKLSSSNVVKGSQI